MPTTDAIDPTDVPRNTCMNYDQPATMIASLGPTCDWHHDDHSG